MNQDRNEIEHPNHENQISSTIPPSLLFALIMSIGRLGDSMREFGIDHHH
jgi:hypothetical protein